jgi:1,4-dihydroxy-2-naphthoate octaprenyltransferase
MGLGELFVMTYFGFVATVGTAYVQHGHIPARAWWLALAAGSMACALLEANNLRDVDTDVHSGKRTLAARLGVERAHWLYATTGLLATVGFAGGAWPAAPIALIGYGLLWRRFAAKGLRGRELLPLLMLSARLQLALGVLAVVSVELLTR